MIRHKSLPSASLAISSHHLPFSVIANSPLTWDSSRPSLTAFRRWWDVSVRDSSIRSASWVTLLCWCRVSKRNKSFKRTGDDIALNSSDIRTSSSHSGNAGSLLDLDWVISRLAHSGSTLSKGKTFCDIESKVLWIRRELPKKKTWSSPWHDRALITCLRRLR